MASSSSPRCAHERTEEMDGVSVVMQCAACASALGDDEAKKLLVSPLAYFTTYSLTLANTALFPGHADRIIALSERALRTPVTPHWLDNVGRMCGGGRTAEAAGTVVHVFPATANLHRPAVSGFNLLVGELALHAYVAHFLVQGRMDPQFVTDCLLKADLVLVAASTDTTDPKAKDLLAPPDTLITSPCMHMIDAASTKLGEPAFAEGFTGKDRTPSVKALEKAQQAFKPLAEYARRLADVRKTTPLYELKDTALGMGALRMHVVDDCTSKSALLRCFEPHEISLLLDYAQSRVHAFRSDMLTAYNNLSRETPERAKIGPVVERVALYSAQAWRYLEALACAVRMPAKAAYDPTLDAVYGAGWAARPGALTDRLRRAKEQRFLPGHRVLVLTIVASTFAAPGTGTRLLNAAKLMAARAGAWLVLEAVMWPLLPFTFYFNHGFNFCGPATDKGPNALKNAMRGLVHLVWGPPVIMGSARDGAIVPDPQWTTRRLNLTTEDDNTSMRIKCDPYSEFHRELSRRAPPLHLVFDARSPFGTTIYQLFTSALEANTLGKEAVAALCESYRVPDAADLHSNHARAATTVAMQSTSDLSPAEACADAALRRLGVSTIMMYKSPAVKRPRSSGGGGGGGASGGGGGGGGGGVFDGDETEAIVGQDEERGT